MQAAQLTESTGPDAVRTVDIPEPDTDGTAVVVDLEAAGVSFPDLLQTTGAYQVVRPLPASSAPRAPASSAPRPTEAGSTPGNVSRCSHRRARGSAPSSSIPDPCSRFPTRCR